MTTAEVNVSLSLCGERAGEGGGSEVSLGSSSRHLHPPMPNAPLSEPPRPADAARLVPTVSVALREAS
ncbi:hypothetical protein GGQ63_003899 [Prosthecomicrobium pneumaticum]|uniref:Uncharacterized protein n=1 Tax=Prosthecomicrobium pneumaticum TaxID=81895 RepID=A0A7W9L3R4_9HYPH|nr:hypothetical protein [Prosthecomicrobium pneumaticum]